MLKVDSFETLTTDGSLPNLDHISNLKLKESSNNIVFDIYIYIYIYITKDDIRTSTKVYFTTDCFTLIRFSSE